MNADELKNQAAHHSACSTALSAMADAIDKASALRAQAAQLSQEADAIEQAGREALSGSPCAVQASPAEPVAVPLGAPVTASEPTASVPAAAPASASAPAPVFTRHADGSASFEGV